MAGLFILEIRAETILDSKKGRSLCLVGLAAKSPWLQRQFRTPLGLGDRPFVVGRGPVAREGLPPLQPDLKLNDTVPFRLDRKSTRLNSSHLGISYAVFCLKKKKK